MGLVMHGKGISWISISILVLERWIAWFVNLRDWDANIDNLLWFMWDTGNKNLNLKLLWKIDDKWWFDTFISISFLVK